jgi:hypothetical protein
MKINHGYKPLCGRPTKEGISRKTFANDRKDRDNDILYDATISSHSLFSLTVNV